MKNLLIFAVIGLISLSSFSGASAQDAFVQIIHNSPDPAASTVDIYINSGAEPAVPDLAFRAATGVVALPAGVDLEVGIAPGNSSGPQDILATWTYNLPAGSMTVIMANGLLGEDFDLFTNALETTAPDGMVGVLAFHGSQDAPPVDVAALGVGILFENLSYQTFQGYLQVPATNYVLTVAPAGGEPIAAFVAPLEIIPGNSIVVFASGFLTQEPGFNLFAALSDGTVLALAPDDTVQSEETTLDGVKALYR